MLPNESIEQRNERVFQCQSPVVMVTGSSAPRVGLRVIETFLSQNFRAILHSHHRDETSQRTLNAITAAGYQAMLVTGAVEDEAVVEHWVEQTQAAFGRIDVLVNSAAIWDPCELELAKASDYERNFHVNSLGTMLCGQHFGLAMAEQASGGAIVNIGDWAVTRPYRGFAPYFISKGAIESCTRVLAVELAHRNPRVRVNAVMPGTIQLAEGISPERQAKIVSASLLQRAGSADDLAQATLFLATSPFITGVSLPVDGGRTISCGENVDVAAHPDCH